MERNKDRKHNMFCLVPISQNRVNKEDFRGNPKASLDCIPPSYIKTSSKTEGIIQIKNGNILPDV